MLKALDLFHGGEKGVRDRMADTIRKGLSKKVKEIKGELKREVDDKKVIEAIAKKLYVNADRLMRIYRGESSEKLVDYELFSRLEYPLNLSIHQVLGEPLKVKNSQTKKKWSNERDSHPIMLAAGAIGEPLGGHKITREKDIERYVTLRAIKELLHNR